MVPSSQELHVGRLPSSASRVQLGCSQGSEAGASTRQAHTEGKQVAREELAHSFGTRYSSDYSRFSNIGGGDSGSSDEEGAVPVNATATAAAVGGPASVLSTHESVSTDTVPFATAGTCAPGGHADGSDGSQGGGAEGVSACATLSGGVAALPPQVATAGGDTAAVRQAAEGATAGDEGDPQPQDQEVEPSYPGYEGERSTDSRPVREAGVCSRQRFLPSYICCEPTVPSIG